MRWLLMVGVLLVPSVAHGQSLWDYYYGVPTPGEAAISRSIDDLSWEIGRTRRSMDYDYSLGGYGSGVPSYVYPDRPLTRSERKHYFRRTHAEAVRSGTARAPRRIVVRSW